MSKHQDHINNLIKEAKNNDKDAQYELGCMYLKGDGVSKNTLKAKDYFHKSADLGHLLALDKLVELKEHKKFVERHFKRVNVRAKPYDIKTSKSSSSNKDIDLTPNAIIEKQLNSINLPENQKFSKKILNQKQDRKILSISRYS